MRSRGGRKTSPKPLPPTDVRMVALEARCRAFGVSLDKADKIRMRAPYMGSDVGMVIARMYPKHEDAQPIWDTWATLCRQFRTYRLVVLGRSGEPAGTSSGWVSDDTGNGDPLGIDRGPDDRSEEERVADAQAGYDFWQDLLSRSSPGVSWAILAAERGDGPALWRDGQPTRMGYDTLRSIEHLHRALLRFMPA